MCNEPGLAKQMLGSKVVQVGAKDEVEKRALTLVRPLGLEDSEDSLVSPGAAEKLPLEDSRNQQPD